MNNHDFRPYAEYPHLCCAERPEDGDTCNRPREDHGADFKIITNHHQRELVALCDVPADQREYLDYITGEDVYSPRLVQYRGEWYDVSEFQFIPAGSFLAGKGWDGYQSDSFFSGVVIRWGRDWSGGPDYESVIVGRYLT